MFSVLLLLVWFSLYIFFEPYWREPENFIADNCSHVIVVHMPIKILNLELSNSYCLLLSLFYGIIWSLFFFVLILTCLLLLSICYPDNSLIVFLPFILFLSPSPCSLFAFLSLRACVRLKPSREERLLSTQANICPVLNWANMDKANTISFSVPGCLPCCPFIPFLSFLHCCRADCWLTNAHTVHVFK